MAIEPQDCQDLLWPVAGRRLLSTADDALPLAALHALLEAEPGMVVHRMSHPPRQEVFFDTPDGRLGGAGAVLKAAFLPGGPRRLILHSRHYPAHELARCTVCVQGLRCRPENLNRIPPGAVRSSLLRLGLGDVVAPVATATVRTGTITAEHDDGRRLAFTWLALRPRGPRRDAFLVSADCAGPAPRALERRLDDLAADLGLTPTSAPIFSRIPGVADGVAEDGARARAAVGGALGDCALTIFRAHARELAAHEVGARLGLDENGVHDMRVAARRLRAAVRLLGQVLPPPLATDLEAELRWLGDVLGQVRDLDVYLESMPRYAAELPVADAPLLGPFAAHLRRSREAARRDLLAALDSDRYAKLQARLQAFGEPDAAAELVAEAAAQPVAEAAVAIIGERLDKVLERGRRAGKRPTARRLHRLRVGCKNLRYACEWFLPLFPPPFPAFVRRLRSLQSVLGTHHDAAVARDRLREEAAALAAAPAPPGLVLFALGQLAAGKHRVMAEAEAQFAREWPRFKRRKRLRKLVTEPLQQPLTEGRK